MSSFSDAAPRWGAVRAWSVANLLRPVSAILLGLSFAGALAVVAAILDRVGERTAATWIAWCSTNLDNLATHPLAAMVASAFLTEDDPWPWVGLAVVGLWAGARAIGVRRVFVVVVLAHVLATMVSEGILAWRISNGIESDGLRQITDVGPSYVVAAALTTAVLYGRGIARVAAAAVFVVIAPSLFDRLTSWDVAAMGHASTVVLTVLLGGVLRRPSGDP